MLKGEAKGRFIDLQQHPGYKDLLTVLDEIVALQRKELLTTRVEVGKEAEIMYLKARLEGAEKLQTDFIRVAQRLSKLQQ